KIQDAGRREVEAGAAGWERGRERQDTVADSGDASVVDGDAVEGQAARADFDDADVVEDVAGEVGARVQSADHIVRRGWIGGIPGFSADNLDPDGVISGQFTERNRRSAAELAIEGYAVAEHHVGIWEAGDGVDAEVAAVGVAGEDESAGEGAAIAAVLAADISGLI